MGSVLLAVFCEPFSRPNGPRFDRRSNHHGFVVYGLRLLVSAAHTFARRLPLLSDLVDQIVLDPVRQLAGAATDRCADSDTQQHDCRGQNHEIDGDSTVFVFVESLDEVKH